MLKAPKFKYIVFNTKSLLKNSCHKAWHLYEKYSMSLLASTITIELLMWKDLSSLDMKSQRQKISWLCRFRKGNYSNCLCLNNLNVICSYSYFVCGTVVSVPASVLNNPVRILGEGEQKRRIKIILADPAKLANAIKCNYCSMRAFGGFNEMFASCRSRLEQRERNLT